MGSEPLGVGRPAWHTPRVSVVASRQGQGGGDLDHEEGLAVDAARAAIEQEFKIAERLDAKSRNQLAVIAGFFAVAQSAAAITLRATFDATRSGYLVALLIVAAISGGIAILAVLLLHLKAWRLQDEEDVAPEGLREMLAAARDPGRDFAADLMEHYADILTTRRGNNRKRVSTIDSARPWVIVAAMTTLLELALAITILGRG